MKAATKWKDTTSYSRDGKNQEATTWSIQNGPLRITITKGHIYHPGKWVLHCPMLSMSEVEVIDDRAEKEMAQKEAMKLVKRRIKVIQNLFDNL